MRTKHLLLLLTLLLIAQHVYGSSDKSGKENKKVANSVEVRSQAQVLHKSTLRKLMLKTSNGCGVGNFIIPSTGNAALGIQPSIGSIGYEWPDYSYIPYKTIPGTSIKGVAFQRSWWPNNTSTIDATDPTIPYVVVSDVGLFSFLFDGNFSPDLGTMHDIDSIFIPGILKMANEITLDANQPIVLLTSDSVSNYRIRFYSYPNLVEQFNFEFPFSPEIFEVTENSLYITAWDTSGIYTLYHYGTTIDTLYASYALSNNTSNAKEFLRSGDSLFILSSPGDSTTILTTILASDSSVTENNVYAQSGARATYNEFLNTKKFTFQPIDTILGEQILVLNPITAQYVDTLMINLSLDYFKNPVTAYPSFGYFSMKWIGARWDNGINDSVFIANAYDEISVRIAAGAHPQFINATYGCWLRVPENEMKEIQFEVHPNPASTEAFISLKGLMKGRQYKFTITDVKGRAYYTTQLEAYQELELPLDKLIPGVYILNLDTGKNTITKKLIIQ